MKKILKILTIAFACVFVFGNTGEEASLAEEDPAGAAALYQGLLIETEQSEGVLRIRFLNGRHPVRIGTDGTASLEAVSKEEPVLMETEELKLEPFGERTVEMEVPEGFVPDTVLVRGVCRMKEEGGSVGKARDITVYVNGDSFDGKTLYEGQGTLDGLAVAVTVAEDRIRIRYAGMEDHRLGWMAPAEIRLAGKKKTTAQIELRDEGIALKSRGILTVYADGLKTASLRSMTVGKIFSGSGIPADGGEYLEIALAAKTKKERGGTEKTAVSSGMEQKTDAPAREQQPAVPDGQGDWMDELIDSWMDWSDQQAAVMAENGTQEDQGDAGIPVQETEPQQEPEPKETHLEGIWHVTKPKKAYARCYCGATFSHFDGWDAHDKETHCGGYSVEWTEEEGWYEYVEVDGPA